MNPLVRYKPILGESWPGYLMRLSAGNRYEGVKGIADVLKMSSTTLLASPPQDILPLIGISVPADLDAKQTLFDEIPSLYASGRSLRARVCARCVGEMKDPHINSCWDRALVFSCPIHQIFLLETCPNCAAPVSNLRMRVETCDCGYMFERARGVAVDLDFAQMYRALNLDQLELFSQTTFAFSGKQEIKAYRLIRRLNHLTKKEQKTVRLASSRAAFLSLDEARNAHCWFEAWPHNFIRLAHNSKPQTDRNIGSLILGTSSSAAFPAIREALAELYQLRHTALRPKERSQQVIANDQSDYVGIRFLMDATGSHYDTVKYWISQGWLGEVTSSPLKGGQIELKIRKSSALKAIQIIKSTGSVRELAMSTGLKGSALRLLVQAGVLRPISNGRGNWNVRLVPSELFQLSSQLISAATAGRASADRRVLIDHAILSTARKSPALVAPLINALIAKEVALRFFGHTPVLPDELTLRSADLRAWLRKMRARK